MRSLWIFLVFASLLLTAGCRDRSNTEQAIQNQIVAQSYRIPDGGGYFLWGTGVTSPLKVNGHVVLPISPQGSHCSGFTLKVCLEVANDLGLTQGWDDDKLRSFQKQWFGVEPASRRKQMAYALETAGLGREVPLAEVMPGDFIQFNVGKGGHIAVVIKRIEIDGRMVGIVYRSSQPSTKGVGDQQFYFEDTIFTGPVRRDLCTVARLGRT